MQGSIAKTFAKPLTIHTYTAPEDGWVVNSHILEFPTQIFIVDAQYRLKYAEEVKAYAANLAKADHAAVRDAFSSGSPFGRAGFWRCARVRAGGGESEN